MKRIVAILVLALASCVTVPQQPEWMRDAPLQVDENGYATIAVCINSDKEAAKNILWPQKVRKILMQYLLQEKIKVREGKATSSYKILLPGTRLVERWDDGVKWCALYKTVQPLRRK